MNNANTNNHSLADLQTCLERCDIKKRRFSKIWALGWFFLSCLSSHLRVCVQLRSCSGCWPEKEETEDTGESHFENAEDSQSRGTTHSKLSGGLTLDWPRHGGHPHLTVFFIFSGMQCVVCQVPWIKFKLWAVDNLPSILFRDQYYMVNFVLGAIRCVTLRLTATTVWFIWGLFLWSSLIIPNNESCSPQAVFCCFSLFSILFFNTLHSLHNYQQSHKEIDQFVKKPVLRFD